jgi:hypothetical protein
MREYYQSPRTPDVWALPVAAIPGASEGEILHAASHMRQSHYRLTTVGELRRITQDFRVALGDLIISIVWEPAARGLVVTMEPPPLEVATDIAAAFGAPKPNPYHEPSPSSGARHASSLAAVLYVDVNSVREASHVGTTVAAAAAGSDASGLAVGQHVWAVDADDNAGVAVVVERRRDWLRLRVDESTWAPFNALAGARQTGGQAGRRVLRRAAPRSDHDRRAHRRSVELQPAFRSRSRSTSADVSALDDASPRVSWRTRAGRYR